MVAHSLGGGQLAVIRIHPFNFLAVAVGMFLSVPSAYSQEPDELLKQLEVYEAASASSNPVSTLNADAIQKALVISTREWASDDTLQIADIVLNFVGGNNFVDKQIEYPAHVWLSVHQAGVDSLSYYHLSKNDAVWRNKAKPYAEYPVLNGIYWIVFDGIAGARDFTKEKPHGDHMAHASARARLSVLYYSPDEERMNNAVRWLYQFNLTKTEKNLDLLQYAQHKSVVFKGNAADWENRITLGAITLRFEKKTAPNTPPNIALLCAGKRYRFGTIPAEKGNWLAAVHNPDTDEVERFAIFVNEEKSVDSSEVSVNFYLLK